MDERSRLMQQVLLTIDEIKKLPPSRELSIAATKLQEARMWIQDLTRMLIDLGPPVPGKRTHDK
jgi:hypothetical protein